MKYIYLFASLMILASCHYQEKRLFVYAKTDWSFYDLKGQVKSISEKINETLTIPGVNRGLDYKTTSTHFNNQTFDENGKLISEIKSYDGSTPIEEAKFKGRDTIISKLQYINGKIALITKYTRNSAGNVTEIMIRNDDNTQQQRTVMVYKGKNLSEKKIFNSRDSLAGWIIYSYDSKGNLEGEIHSPDNSFGEIRDIYKYDSIGRKIFEARYNEDTLFYENTYKYEGKNISKSKYRDGSGLIESITKYSYDKKGNVTDKYENSPLSKEKWEIHTTYKFGNNNNVIGITETTNDTLTGQAVYKYDRYNNLIFVKSTVWYGESSVSEMSSFTYEYDIHGNWIKKTENTNDRKSTNKYIITDRKITYFE